MAKITLSISIVAEAYPEVLRLRMLPRKKKKKLKKEIRNRIIEALTLFSERIIEEKERLTRMDSDI